MSFDQTMAALMASWIVNNRERKKQEQETKPKRQGIVATEILFVKSRERSLQEPYKELNPTCPQDLEAAFGIAPLKADEWEALREHYARIAVAPHSLEYRTELIHALWTLWREKGVGNVNELLQNEVVYLIDHVKPTTAEEEMYRHLAMFLSSECHFFKGEFAKAVKRLYQALDWNEIYDNATETDSINLNGLYYFHEAIVSNIINIYALASLPEKADEIRIACRVLVEQAYEDYNFTMTHPSNMINMYEFAQKKFDMLMATDGLQGYYIFDTIGEKNIFKNAFQTVIREKAIYDIAPLPYDYKAFSVIEEKQRTAQGSVCRAHLHMWGVGKILDYKEALARDREALKRI